MKKVKPKIVVFGASGGVGLEVVKQALETGHMVTAFVRSPEKFTLSHDNLTIFKGDALDAAAVENAIAGQGAVVSALGPSRPPVPHMMEIAANNIVEGMKKHGIQRLVCTSGAGIRQREDRPKWIDRFISFLLNLFAKNVALDSAAAVDVLGMSGLEWTVVRFPRLRDGALTRRYRVGFVNRNSGTEISRADGADFVLKELVEENWLWKLPLVSY